MEDGLVLTKVDVVIVSVVKLYNVHIITRLFFFHFFVNCGLQEINGENKCLYFKTLRKTLCCFLLLHLSSF